jgi:2-amino-4-hydroxy-6-hydroxymethyldihydropteridine diphosphokinase
MHECCILVGSNVSPEYNLPLGLRLLQRSVEILRISTVWDSPAVGSKGPNFLNAAALVLTPLETPVALQGQILRPLEAQMGRLRTEDKNADRTIDFDIVIFDGRVIDPIFWQYAYRVVPAADVIDDLHPKLYADLKAEATRLLQTAPLRARPDVTRLVQMIVKN